MKNYFYCKDGHTLSNQCVQFYTTIKEYAERHKLSNTIIALDLACKLHSGQYRDGGAPYIIHPLEITQYVIHLNINNAILDMYLDKLHDYKLAEEQAKLDLDVVLATSLLHDTVEDCKSDLPLKGVEFVLDYHLHPDILKFVTILTKDKKKPGFTLASYFAEIAKYWQTSLIKVADRTSNCSTIDVFTKKRMEKYVHEITDYFYPLISNSKNMYPYFSRAFTIMKYLIVSINETVASLLNLDDIIISELYEKTYFFIKGFAIGGKKSMPNTLKALPLAKEYYKNLTRKSGDAFIIHPLRVCSYLISLKIDDDTICSAALLHEIIKKCNLEHNGIEIINKYNLTPSVLDYIRLLANTEHYPLDLYYEALRHSPEVMLLKLSNRAHTCTALINYSDDEIREYIDECEKYIYPLCEYGIIHYPEYSYSIQLMYYHIKSICNVVNSLKLS